MWQYGAPHDAGALTAEIKTLTATKEEVDAAVTQLLEAVCACACALVR